MGMQFALFDTAIGACGIAWSEAGIVALQLPEADRKRTRARLLKRWPDATEAAPAAAVQAAIDTVVALLSGTAPDRIEADLEAIALDLDDVPAFDQKVYAVARTIAPGKTLTYGEIAARIGESGDAREVGQALGRNRIPIIVPCHRVVAAGGGTGGFSARGGVDTKLRLLEIERATFTDGPSLFDDDAAFARLQRR
ncbi:MAG: methylated-DNA--[protein]-cysteine S-methyltransferase [Xanthobacteraceae bacterium]|nr:methylated-DNA--[protein]-cysteine S-methyltransferase [Xanthobacteraceae bacterium]